MPRLSSRKCQTIKIIARLAVIVAAAALSSPSQTTSTVRISEEPAQSRAMTSLPGVESRKFAVDAANPLLLPAEGYPSGGQFPDAVATGDVNGDGKADLVVADWHGSVGVLLGNGDGTFHDAVSYLSGGTPAFGVTLADVNGDSKLDILVANCGAADTCGGGINGVVGVLLGHGDGTFQTAVAYDTGGSQTSSVAVADFNGDGKPDMVVSNSYFSDTVGVLLGNGDGTFQPVVTYGSGGDAAWSVAVADVNGDGKPDILVANADTCYACNGDGLLGVLLGNGNGTFQPAVTYSTGKKNSFNSVSMAAADLNGDGKVDVAMTSGSSIGIFLGNSDGTFQPVVQNSLSGTATAVTIADVNGDGKRDLLVVNGTSDAVSVLLGNGDGTFQSAMNFDSGGTSPDAIAVADVNGDSKLDVAVTDANDFLVSLLLNGTAGTRPTTATVVSSLNPSNYLQTVTLTTTVTATTGTAKGTVIFRDGARAIGNAVLANGSASLVTQSLQPGSRSITVLYGGSGVFEPTTSPVLTQVVHTAVTATSLSSSSNPVLVKRRVTYTATVTSQYPWVGGGVTFQDGGTRIAIVPVVGNQASYHTFYKTNGVHAITATYSGDFNNAASSSSTLTQDVAGQTQMVLGTSGSPSHAGQPVTFTATVTSNYGQIPNGEVITFYDFSKIIGTGVVSGGVATFTTSTLTVKTHTIKAAYGGDATFGPSKGKITQVVNP